MELIKRFGFWRQFVIQFSLGVAAIALIAAAALYEVGGVGAAWERYSAAPGEGAARALTGAISSALWTTALVALAIICLVLLINAFLAVSFRKDFSRISQAVAEVADGDLKVKLSEDGMDGVAVLAHDLNRMVKAVRGVVKGIVSSSEDVVRAVDAVSEGAASSAEGAREQAGMAAQVATVSEQMSRTVMDIARNAAQASEATTEAMRTAEGGRAVSVEAERHVKGVHASTAELGSMVERLGGRVKEIGDILTVINDIADQTNLLALNAAIEAARAGEQGRGFAVVADEVRKLAERTVRATAEISGKISAVQAESARTSRSMHEAAGLVTRSDEAMHRVGEALDSIVRTIQEAGDQVTRIAAAVEQQSSATEEVSTNMEHSAKTAANTERLSARVQGEVKKLADIARRLNESTQGFRL